VLSSVGGFGIDETILGCVTQIGSKRQHYPRRASFGGRAEKVSGITSDRKCGSAEAAIGLAAALNVLLLQGSSEV
jgi:acetyl-CoA acetyltransferase